MVENSVIIFPDFLLLRFGFTVLPAPPLPTFAVFVIAAPKRQTWMAAQTFYIFNSFLFYVFQKFSITRIHCTCEHKILPNKNSLYVTKLVKKVVFINSTAPNAKHIHICSDHIINQSC